MITSVFEEIVKYMKQHQDVRFAKHEEFGRWALAQKGAQLSEPLLVMSAAAGPDRFTPPRLTGLDP
jgi:hypothetical protein